MPSKHHFPLMPRLSVILKQPKFFPSSYDFVALILFITLLALIAVGVKAMNQPLIKLQTMPIELHVSNLPKYALYTTLRMFSGVIASLLFTFTVATLAAKNRRAEILIIPVLDVLQSVPVLGFLTFSVSFFMGLFPGYETGAELAAIFAVFTAQAWNMAFSFYQSLRTIPVDLREASDQFQLNAWQKFWRLEVPFAMPGLVWNTMMSMSGSWFFIVAAEAISVGDIKIALPGIGSWLSLAIQNKDLVAVGLAVVTMGLVILAYDQIIFRPVVAWSDKFNMGQTASQLKPQSWLYDVLKRSKGMEWVTGPMTTLRYKILCMRWPAAPTKTVASETYTRYIDFTWIIFVCTLMYVAILFLFNYLHTSITIYDCVQAIMLGLITMIRVLALVLLASLIWVPIGVWVGLRPKMVAIAQPMAQFLAAFPANILFPFAVVIILQFQLNPDIWLSPLMILGTQWYIFFNVIAGVIAFPHDLKEAASIYHIKSWVWWRRVMLPGIFPYYVTGALTASGGCWNASIVAEVVSWGSTKLEARGIGSYIANASAEGDFHRVVLGVAVMSILVIIINRLFWHKLYAHVAKAVGLE